MNYIGKLFHNPVLRTVPKTELFHKLLQSVGKFLRSDTHILTSRLSWQEIESMSWTKKRTLRRLSNMGHICILMDAKLIALNIQTNADTQLVETLDKLSVNSKAKYPKATFCNNIILSRILDLGYNMVEQYYRATLANINLVETFHTNVKIARYTPDGLKVLTTTMKNCLTNPGSPWYNQLFTTKEQQVEFTYWADFMQSLRSYDNNNKVIPNEERSGRNKNIVPSHYFIRDGKIHTIKNLYAVEMVKTAALAKVNDTELVMV